MDGLNDLDTHFKRFIRSEARYRYGELGINQNETSLDRNVLIKDTTLSNRLKKLFMNYGVMNISDLENLRAFDFLRFKGMGQKLHEEYGQFCYVNKLGVYRD